MRGALVAVAAGAAAWAPAFRYDALPRRPTRRAAATTHGDQIVVALTREAGKNGGLARALYLALYLQLGIWHLPICDIEVNYNRGSSLIHIPAIYHNHAKGNSALDPPRCECAGGW